jgi:hypothetical protein
MKVTVIDNKSGKEKSMAPRFAKILTGLGRATYMTRDMVAVPSAPPAPSPAPAALPLPAAPQYMVKVGDNDLILDNMDAERLHTLAKEMGVKVHHASGADKVRAALVESQSAPKE